MPQTKHPTWTGQLLKSLLGTLLQYYTCGWIVQTLAELEEANGFGVCSQALKSILRVDPDVIDAGTYYVRGEPVRHTATLPQAGVNLYREVHKALHEREGDER